MNEGFGIPAHGEHAHEPHRASARYLVLIDVGGTSTARLFGADREPLLEFDGGSEEVADMTRGLAPVPGAQGAEWNQALAGHSAAERAAAQVFALDV